MWYLDLMGVRTVTGESDGWRDPVSLPRTPVRRYLLSVLVVASIAAACVPPSGDENVGEILPPPPPKEEVDRFLSVPMLTGLTAPTNVEFAPDGRVFVAEKSGIIRTFDSISDTTGTVAADLEASVRSIGDHGLLGLAVDPLYPTRPYLYALYTWDITGLWGDDCEAGYNTNGCVTGGRIDRMTLDADGRMVGTPTTIVDDRWCYQFASHGVGDLEFLSDGTLLATSGEGAHWGWADYGQSGGTQRVPPVENLTPRNPCDDPPNGVGGPVEATTSEGGAFRSQDLLTPDDPVTWDGSLVRIDPNTGEAPPDNPLQGDDPADDAVVAHGLRNPFRFAVEPGTDDVYLIDVGFNWFEEINVIDPTAGSAKNFGWPCFEGSMPEPTYQPLANLMCTSRIESADAPTELTGPWYAYGRPGAGAAISAIEFIPQGRYPSQYDNTLIFSDYVKGLTWSLPIDEDGAAASSGPVPVLSEGIIVDLEAGPDGYIYAVDFVFGTVSRFVDRASAPVARLAATATEGPVPLAVTLDASASEDAGDASLRFEWDLDEDGVFDDSAAPTVSLVIEEPVTLTVAVRVTNDEGASSTASETIFAGNTPPEVRVEVSSPLPWSAGDDVTFEIVATDAEDGFLPAVNVSWSAQIHHCHEPGDCHMHPYTEATGSLGGTIEAPSHGYPSFLRLVATATDSRGQMRTASLDLDPASVEIRVNSSPSGAVVVVGDRQKVTPFSFTAVRNDGIALTVPSPQSIGGVEYLFSSWEHGGGQSHGYLAGEDTTLDLVLQPIP
jgi:glucose/arabinose dehydrogenase